jgi:hypothetical protein
MYDWIKLFCQGSFLRNFSEEEAEIIMREVEDMCRIDCCDEQGKWAIMYTRLRFKAIME